jgi:hypothetical protein
VSDKWRTNRAAVTDDEMRMLACYDKDIQVTGWSQREHAREQAYRKSFEPSAPERPAAPPSAVAQRTEDDLSTPEKFDAWATKYAGAAVPVELWKWFVAMAREKREILESRTTVLETELTALRTRLAEVEAQKSEQVFPGWTGPHAPGRRYRPGELTQRNGVWCCTRETESTPGSDPSCWRLFVHRKLVPTDDDR